ncbi:C-type mannose receptor 2-like [Megalops cyprinoides]|uniref:C-type mannose receptor 2-like n=1 Tax=Megalops cyprinoides TaxID=118141 RepID=UPI001864DA07|nr:C-type mannose receptor 2-like [Megalops cyprinoides]
MKNRGGVFLTLFISGLYSLTSSITPQYHFVNDKKNWTEAQRYCREQYWDLPSIYSIEDMESLTEAVHSGFDGRAWIGLERGILQTWHWSFTDKDFYRHGEFEFRNWKNGELSNGDSKDSCAAMHPNGRKKDFILHKDDKTWREAQTFCRENHSDLVSVRNQSENQKIQSVLQSQSAWIGLFSDPWRWSDCGNSSFRFWNSKQPNNFRGNQHCVAAVLSKSGRWNDLKCSSSRPFFCQSDYLILIHENKTWKEALSYCREHHVSLVSVTNAVTQSWVAKKAENASTTHVWLGLRFTCTFNFWFWITSEPGCYQNWADGHGPGGLGVCGHTGAIESGGAHQWVSLPETERLNFICYTCGGRRH